MRAEDGPEDRRSPFNTAFEDCRAQMEKLAALVGELEGRVSPFRLSVPRPEDDAKVATARDLHSSAVDHLHNLRDNAQSLQRRLAVLLEELEI